MDKEMIGKVTLDLSHYSSEDFYSDGEIEDVLLEAVSNNNAYRLLKSSSDFAVLYHLSEIRHNLMEWYPIGKEDTVLEIGSGCGGITGVLAKKATQVTCVELSKKRSLINAHRHKDMDNITIKVGNFQDIEPDLDKYDVVTLIGVWEYSALYLKTSQDPFLAMIRMAKKHLKKNGRIVIAIENKMGLKYFNGAYEDHTSKQYDGINDYIDADWVRTFSKQEIEKILNKARIKEYAFKYPMPDYKLPDVIYSDNILPVPGELRTYGKDYQSPRFYNFNDAIATDQIANDGMFEYFANSFIIEIGKPAEVMFVKYNRDRKPEFRIATKIEKANDVLMVKKYALNKDAVVHINSFKKNESLLNNKMRNGLKCIKGTVEDNVYICPYVEGVTLQEEFYPYRNNLKKFISLAKKYVDAYILPAKDNVIAFKPTDKFREMFGECTIETMSAPITNIDLSFSNIKRSLDGDLCVFDFEWVYEMPIPYKYPAWRALYLLNYHYRAYLSRKIDVVSFIKKCGFTEKEHYCFLKMEKNFSDYVYGKNGSMSDTKNYVKNNFTQKISMY